VPKGNLNALKNGFYTSRIKSSDLVGLPDHDFKGLEEEITLLRLLIRRLVERSNDAESLPEYTSTICFLSKQSNIFMLQLQYKTKIYLRKLVSRV